jgi:hypothetical protein
LLAPVYTIREALKKSRLVSSFDGYEEYCDGINHYVADPSGIAVSHGCNCPDGQLHRQIQMPVARPRYEVYNKDPDFFWDHDKGVMFELSLAGGSKQNWSLASPDWMIWKIVELMNREDCAEALRGKHENL